MVPILVDDLLDRSENMTVLNLMCPILGGKLEEPTIGELGQPGDQYYFFTKDGFKLLLNHLQIPIAFYRRLVEADGDAAQAILNVFMPDTLRLITLGNKIVQIFEANVPFVPAIMVHDTICEQISPSHIVTPELDDGWYSALYMVTDDLGVSVCYSDIYLAPPRIDAAIMASMGNNDIILRLPVGHGQFYKAVDASIRVLDQIRLMSDKALDTAKNATVDLTQMVSSGATSRVADELGLTRSMRGPLASVSDYEASNAYEWLSAMRQQNPLISLAERYSFDIEACKRMPV